MEQTISVSLIDDSPDELSETFDLTLSNPAGATISDSVATGTIEDDDPEPIMDFTGYFGFFPYGRLGRGSLDATFTTERSDRDALLRDRTLGDEPGRGRQ